MQKARGLTLSLGEDDDDKKEDDADKKEEDADKKEESKEDDINDRETSPEKKIRRGRKR